MATTRKKVKPARKAKGSGGKWLGYIVTPFKWIFGIAGMAAVLMLLISFTDLPYNVWYKLGTKNAKTERKPDVIIILSGSGMPSPDGLMRAWYGARAARQFPAASIIIALPYNEGDSLQPLRIMASELAARGIDSTRIRYEPLGFNTHAQAVNIAFRYPETKGKSVMLVTSPEHMYRSVKVFKKTGFAMVGGMAAFDTPIDPEKVADTGTGTDKRVKSLNLRYNMWSYLHYELYVLREYAAIAYYKLKGWI
jgi:uncharacterized SAM-binding protein YcdF (DUF218 family)